ncbi:DUF6503 family protein [Marixanthomonas spongiae]|uniref:Heat-shock protein Hsp90 n=1 Tax=Marixanthomonas spongiae TaxID=2174845 RepID=A0A2U0I5G6_9FLAO|nr:DUF6503 family protein [Marixanthomonas spongiae]PVW16351.1 hypothetical protein DDV96_03575 [Marixanthomonas spongiae]
MKKALLIFAVLIAGFSCKNITEKNTEEIMPVEQDNGIGDGAPSLSAAFAQGVENTHNKEAFLAHNNVSFDITLNFKGKERLNGKFTMRTNSSKIKFESEEGNIIIYDGEDVFISPVDATPQSARFDIFTWPYFMALPFKLTDTGTVLGPVEQVTEKGQDYSSAKLTFKNGIGDTADDWYMVYVDNNTNLLSYAAYIVTYGKSVEEAEKTPHAILYANYQVVDGIALADKWKFYNWNSEKGLYGEPIGDAVLSTIKFVESVDYSIPENSKTIKAPN